MPQTKRKTTEMAKPLLPLKPETLKMVSEILKMLETVWSWDCFVEDTRSTSPMAKLENLLDESGEEIYEISTPKNRGPTNAMYTLSAALENLRESIDQIPDLAGKTIDALKPYVEKGEESK